MKFDVNVIVKKAVKDAEVIAGSEKITDMTTTDSKKVRGYLKQR
jgi:hypothetical protein